ncbi:UxaA family hydrolase [Marinomonas balearica]|uniref:Altronate hydrolase/galactarate dehydratase n=1 Tax=Marinomonas balearica TaxID=491947 RepID=A0A4R6MCZ7_9GAMM|nr:altronate dehydratase family protein [Marinomonas balearica]TDO99547.1 altronate hydrolase/galactarate dehydratase [Marinomonas balearica]
MIIGSKQSIRLHAHDNVAIALSDLSQGSNLTEFDVTLLGYVPRGHKVAIKEIAKGDNVVRYGQVIGQATQAIAIGEHVHVQNMGMGAHLQDYAFSKSSEPLPPISSPRTFNGFHRENGKVGTRNYVGILTSVNCAGSVARFIEEAANKSDFLKDYSNIDGIVPIVHSTGCGMSSQGEGYQTLHRTLMGYANNPNFGGILLVGLGCEVLQVSSLVDRQEPSAAFRYMSIQSEGGTRKTVEKGLQELHALASEANKATRKPAPVSQIMVGMQCGGSDGYSGITANPALGYASDLLVRHGGTTILSETSEVYGAEHLLTCRAVSEDVGKKLIDRIHWWEDYCARNGGEMDNNPSPGNKNGGLTTILEKSLGAVAKSGNSPLMDVYQFGETIDKKGFVFMDSPGFDPCSVTGQVASGANIIIFTTGRGSVSGYKPTPCIKLATNTEMYHRLQEDMDLNCGDIVTSGISIEEKGSELFELIIRIASGEETKSEALGYGGVEFVPWQIGAVM